MLGCLLSERVKSLSLKGLPFASLDTLTSLRQYIHISWRAFTYAHPETPKGMNEHTSPHTQRQGMKSSSSSTSRSSQVLIVAFVPALPFQQGNKDLSGSYEHSIPLLSSSLFNQNMRKLPVCFLFFLGFFLLPWMFNVLPFFSIKHLRVHFPNFFSPAMWSEVLVLTQGLESYFSSTLCALKWNSSGLTISTFPYKAPLLGGAGQYKHRGGSRGS